MNFWPVPEKHPNPIFFSPNQKSNLKRGAVSGDPREDSGVNDVFRQRQQKRAARWLGWIKGVPNGIYQNL